jgi:hypothetical protein
LARCATVRPVRGLVVLLIGVFAVACTSPAPTQPGAPVASSAAAPSPSAQSSVAPSVVAPTSVARPREVRLDSVDPCTLLTPAQRTSLGLGGTPQPYTSGRPTPGKACSITGFEPRAVNVSLTVATTVGINAITAPGAVSDKLTPTVISGFPAILARPRNPDGCVVDIDVAQGQLLDALFRDGGGAVPIPQDQLCRDATNLARQAMTTLLGR